MIKIFKVTCGGQWLVFDKFEQARYALEVEVKNNNFEGHGDSEATKKIILQEIKNLKENNICDGYQCGEFKLFVEKMDRKKYKNFQNLKILRSGNMKQHITVQELREFIESPAAMAWLCNQLGTNYVKADMVNIGAMIEILERNLYQYWLSNIEDLKFVTICNINKKHLNIKKAKKELCDALWAAVQYIYGEEE